MQRYLFPETNKELEKLKDYYFLEIRGIKLGS
jgi:hypothetical protein